MPKIHGRTREDVRDRCARGRFRGCESALENEYNKHSEGKIKSSRAAPSPIREESTPCIASATGARQSIIRVPKSLTNVRPERTLPPSLIYSIPFDLSKLPGPRGHDWCKP